MRNLEAVLVKYLEEFATRFETTFKGKFPPDYRIVDTISVKVEDNEVVVYVADYIDFIENGRKPGSKMPPIEVMKEFINVRRIIPRSYNNNKPPSLDSLAFLLGRSIARDGILPRPYYGESYEETKFDMEDFSKEFEREIAELFK